MIFDLSSTAKEWVDIFAKYNSGTYNNQVRGVLIRIRRLSKNRQETSLVFVFLHVDEFSTYYATYYA